MEENEDVIINEAFFTPEEDEVQKNRESTEGYSTPVGEVQNSQTNQAAKKSGKSRNGNTAKNDDKDCCATKKKLKSEKELKWRTINIFEKECKPPKSNPVPRHCISKKEHLNILATPKQKCPPPCLQKEVVRKLAPVSPRILQLAKPAKHRILRTIEERSDTLPPKLLDNLIKMLEAESSLSPEQTTKLLRDKKCRPTKKRRKKKRQTKCKGRESEKRKNIDHPRFDPEAVCCHYQMAEKFVKSILNWKCSVVKEDFQNITEIILRRLSQTLEYTPTDGNGDRRSQQMRFLADVISCWISGVMTEVEEAHRESEEDRARRQREEEKEETDDEDDGFYGDKGDDDGDDDDDDDDEDDDDEDDRGKKGKKGEEKKDQAEEKADDDPGDKKSDQKSESDVWEDARMELDNKSVQETPEVQEAEAQIQPEVAEKETEVDVPEEEIEETPEADDAVAEDVAEEVDDGDEATDEEDEVTVVEIPVDKEEEKADQEEPTENVDKEDKAEDKEEKEEEKVEDKPEDKEDEEPKPTDETDRRTDSLKLFQTDLPFINFMQIFSTIYKTMDNEEENLGQDPIVNRVHRAIYEKCHNAVMLDDPELLTNNAKDLIDVMTGKIAVWLSKVLTESQILFLDKYPPQVESFEVRDWTKWLNHTTKTAKNWSVWLQSLIKEIQKMQDGKVSRGEWSDWTKQVDTNAALWRRFYLDAVHQAHHNVMMIRDREIVKTGEKRFPELEKEIRAVDL